VAEADEVGGALCECGGMGGRRGGEGGGFGAVVCGDGVDDDEGGGVPGQHDGELVGEDVVLGFEVGGLEGEDSGEGGGWGGG